MTLDIAEKSIEKFKYKPNSTVVDYLDFDGSKKKLKVKFKNGKHKGKVRLYSNVAPEEFCRIMNSDSVGKSVIKLSETHNPTNLSFLHKLGSFFSLLF